jgi:histone deacetylase 1/2
MAESSMRRPRVDYFYDESVGNFVYSPNHPMRPHRVRLTHHLVVGYGLYKHLNVFRPKKATRKDFTAFHSDDYVQFLQEVTPENAEDHLHAFESFGIGDDCPIFDGLYEYCQTYTGGSLSGAARLNQGCADIVANWAGGLHHAKKNEAEGFCYINDIVLAILELLKVHARVLYVDIDIHHGDGVEEAFYTTNRVMTLSFHQSNGFFPRTGFVDDHGAKIGKHHALNFPLLAGMDDESYASIFKPVIAKVMECYRPSVVVMCCGADSLSADRVGCWNLSIRGHAAVIEYIKSFDLPMLVLGGGGYTIRNVARCWAYETSCILGQPVSDIVPQNEYKEYYLPDYKLHVPVSNMENDNTRPYLEKTLAQVLDCVSKVEAAPNVGLQTGQPGTRRAPDTLFNADSDDDDTWDADTRPRRKGRAHLAEYVDDDEGDQMMGTDVAVGVSDGRVAFDGDD